MYKALFELSSDRADFVSKLFSVRRPTTLNSLSTPEQIFTAFSNVQKSEALYNVNLKAIDADLVEKHHFALDPETLDAIAGIYEAFYTYGPGIRYSSSQPGGFGGFNQPSYAELMTAADADGKFRSYLASEPSFQVLKDLETRNLLLPVVGNFGGPKAIRRGQVRERSRIRRIGVLSVKRGDVPLSGGFVERVLPQRRRSSSGRQQHLHPFLARGDLLRSRLRSEPVAQ